jgi:hypothetical protein
LLFRVGFLKKRKVNPWLREASGTAGPGVEVRRRERVKLTHGFIPGALSFPGKDVQGERGPRPLMRSHTGDVTVVDIFTEVMTAEVLGKERRAIPGHQEEEEAVPMLCGER